MCCEICKGLIKTGVLIVQLNKITEMSRQKLLWFDELQIYEYVQLIKPKLVKMQKYEECHPHRQTATT